MFAASNGTPRTAKRSLGTIDIAKFIGSILIFAMHCVALGDYEDVQFVLTVMARWGVPFFFVCSAYLLFSKSEGGNITREQLLHYVSRIDMLYC